MNRTSARASLIGLASITLVVGLAACSASGPADTGAAGPGGDQPSGVAELVEDATAEGGVTVYAALDERILELLREDFEEIYGVDLNYIRASSTEIAQRFSAERDAQAPVADAVLTLHDGFITEGVADGAFTPLEDADIPGFPGALPEDSLVDGAAIVQVAQLAIAYNTDHVDALEGWEDLLDPRLEGRLAITSTDSALNNALYYSLGQEYGDDYLTDLSGQIGRVYTSGSQSIEAASAGEMFAISGTLGAAIKIAQSMGAPIDAVVPSPTMSVPAVVAVNADAPRPAAARLFAYYLTTEDGLTAINDGLGMVSPTDPAAFDGGWLFSPELDAEAAPHRAAVKEMLGIE